MQKAVIGLDFGTSFSGFAFARADVPDDIRVEENWPFQQQATGSVYQKTKTCVASIKMAA
jgi:molecular chaperone DnaK (HSP70)